MTDNRIRKSGVSTPPYLCPDGSNPCGRYGYCGHCPHDKSKRMQAMTDKPEVVEHQCSMSLRCKSDTCTHAKPHTPSDCDCPACCGQWPSNADFKPSVVCIPVEQVRAPEDSGKHEKPEAPLTDHERLQAEAERLQAQCEEELFCVRQTRDTHFGDMAITDWREHSKNYAKGETPPATIETLQAAWLRDQELIEDLLKEIAYLKSKVNKLTQKGN